MNLTPSIDPDDPSSCKTLTDFVRNANFLTELESTPAFWERLSWFLDRA
jgi:hypothetical protein